MFRRRRCLAEARFGGDCRGGRAPGPACRGTRQAIRTGFPPVIRTLKGIAVEACREFVRNVGNEVFLDEVTDFAKHGLASRFALTPPLSCAAREIRNHANDDASLIAVNYYATEAMHHARPILINS